MAQVDFDMEQATSKALAPWDKRVVLLCTLRRQSSHGEEVKYLHYGNRRTYVVRWYRRGYIYMEDSMEINGHGIRYPRLQCTLMTILFDMI